MSQNVPLSKKTIFRLPKIKQGLLDGLNYDQIAENCGVKSSQTIDRDMKAWVQSGDFELWIRTEFTALYSHVKMADPITAFKELAKMVSKTFVQKQEVKQEVNLNTKHVEELNVNLATYEDTVQKVVARHLQTNRT